MASTVSGVKFNMVASLEISSSKGDASGSVQIGGGGETIMASYGCWE